MAQARDKVLVVDDEPAILSSISDLLESEFDVITAKDPRRGLENLVDEEISVLISDQRMPNMSGDEFLCVARERSLAVRVLMTGFADIEALARIVNDGKIYAYVTKPWDPLGLRTTIRNAASEYRLLNALRYERDLLRTLVNNIPDCVYVQDSDQRYTLVNRAFAELVGMADPREAVGKTERECLRGNFGDNAATDGHSVLKTGQPIISKCDEWKRDDGTVRWYASTRVPVRNPVDQHIDGLVGISRDITEEKQIENHLRVAKETAEETVRAKQEFLARTSHEIRTPLNSILGMTEVLSETGLSEQQKRYIGVLRTNSEMLMRLLTDLLDLSRGDLHELTLVATAFDTREIVGSVIEYFKQDAFRKGVGLLLEVADNVPFRLIGDSGRLTQILSNLVNNALKFTDLGRITIKVNCTSIENQSVLLDFSVEDTGIGIAPDKLDAIFEPFSQAEEFITGRYGGSGLGLTICRQLVHQMGGTISVQSSLGEASIFRFTTRFLLAGEERPAVAISNHPALIQKSLSGLTVLMAEDNVDNIFLMQVYLGPARMEIAVNGREAVDRFMAGRFDVVLMDLQMPEMDGLQATRLIRQWEQHHKKIPTPILACTAHEFSEEASLRAGCTGHLIKPITRETLLAAIDRCVSVSN